MPPLQAFTAPAKCTHVTLTNWVPMPLLLLLFTLHGGQMTSCDVRRAPKKQPQSVVGAGWLMKGWSPGIGTHGHRPPTASVSPRTDQLKVQLAPVWITGKISAAALIHKRVKGCLVWLHRANIDSPWSSSCGYQRPRAGVTGTSPCPTSAGPAAPRACSWLLHGLARIGSQHQHGRCFSQRQRGGLRHQRGVQRAEEGFPGQRREREDQAVHEVGCCAPAPGEGAFQGRALPRRALVRSPGRGCRWKNGHCRFGERCNFAHGEEELRRLPSRGNGFQGEYGGQSDYRGGLNGTAFGQRGTVGRPAALVDHPVQIQVASPPAESWAWGCAGFELWVRPKCGVASKPRGCEHVVACSNALASVAACSRLRPGPGAPVPGCEFHCSAGAHDVHASCALLSGTALFMPAEVMMWGRAAATAQPRIA